MTPSPTYEAIKTRPWLNDAPFPVGVTMLSGEELLMLRWLAKNAYTGEGSLLDCGCFLGGSTTAFAEGLKAGRAANKKLHSFDLFVAGPFEGKAYAKEGLMEGKSFRAQYDQAIAGIKDYVEVHEGDITQAALPAGDIELLFIDCAKIPTVNDFFVTKLFPKLVPGKSIVVQQDYLYQALPWIQITMEYFAEYFEVLASTEVNSVIYGCVKQIPARAAVGGVWSMMSKSVKHALMQRAINRWEGHKRQLVIGAYASYDIDADKWGWLMSAR